MLFHNAGELIPLLGELGLFASNQLYSAIRMNNILSYAFPRFFFVPMRFNTGLTPYQNRRQQVRSSSGMGFLLRRLSEVDFEALKNRQRNPEKGILTVYVVAGEGLEPSTFGL